jgi:glycerol dehydrogenase
MRNVRVLVSPAKYVQGPGVLAEGSTYIKTYGERIFVVAGTKVNQLPAYRSLVADLEGAGCAVIEAQRNPEITEAEIDRLTDVVGREGGAEVVVGVGGGKALDTARAVANHIGAGMVSIPTIAATDAPTAASSVIYTEDGAFLREVVWPRNPDLVLVDSEVVVEAPVRYLVSGMGDALATWFEAESCSVSGVPAASGGHQTEVALAIARLCYDTLREHGVQAKLAAEHQIVSHAVEKVIEANILHSGIGWESGGMAAAHSIHNGLTIRPEGHAYYHGEKVAFGLLAQLILEDRSGQEIREVTDFCLAVGLPVCLADLGMERLARGDVLAIAEAACSPEETIHATPFDVTPPMVAEAILAADAMGQACREQRS